MLAARSASYSVDFLLSGEEMSLQIHFLRHAETTAPTGSMVGSTDVGLSAQGMDQAKQLAVRLPTGMPCLCSPMLRARQTLEQLQVHGVACDVRFDERLREMNFGDYEMKTFAEITDNGADVDAWIEYTHFTFPGGESVAHFTHRLQELLLEFRTRKDEQVLVLTHGGVIRTMLCLALGLDTKNYLLFNVMPGSWSTVELYSQGGVLTALNR